LKLSEGRLVVDRVGGHRCAWHSVLDLCLHVGGSGWIVQAFAQRRAQVGQELSDSVIVVIGDHRQGKAGRGPETPVERSLERREDVGEACSQIREISRQQRPVFERLKLGAIPAPSWISRALKELLSVFPAIYRLFPPGSKHEIASLGAKK